MPEFSGLEWAVVLAGLIAWGYVVFVALSHTFSNRAKKKKKKKKVVTFKKVL